MAALPQDPPEDKIELGVLADLAGYHLRRASAAFAADFVRALDGADMRQVPFGILSVIAANPGINQGAIGRSLGIQRANMVSLINELVDRALVERRASAADRRAFALRLTEAGKAKLDHCIERIRAHEEDMLSGLGAAERGKLIALLVRIDGGKRPARLTAAV